MIFDEFDIKVLEENFSEDLVSQIDLENLKNIFNYLNENDVYYAKDLLLTSLDLFLLPHEIFIKKFEVLKNKLFNAGIQGKLTKQKEEDGSAEELFLKIRKWKCFAAR